MKLEKEIQANLIKIASKHPNVHFIDRSNSGKVKVKGGWMQLHKKGFPDLCGWVKGGKFLGIELKRPDTKNNTSKDQDSMLELMRESGCICGIAHDEESLMDILDNIGQA